MKKSLFEANMPRLINYFPNPMKVQIEKQPKSQVKIVVELEDAEREKYLQKAAKDISNIVKVPGFRPGHAPLEVLKAHVSEDKIESHMWDIALQESYTEAVLKNDVKAVSRPKIDVKSTNPFVYEAVVAVYPEVKISGYEKIKIDHKEPKVEDKEIDDVLNDIRRRRAKYVKVDRAAKNGDRVEIDFAGFDEGGAPLENTDSKHHPLILGDKTMIPGFEEEIVGVKNGEDREFTVTFPKDYHHKPFQNKKVKFKIHVHQVDEIQLPEFTPEFLKEIAGSDKTLDEVKAIIKENLQNDKKSSESMRRENELLEEIIKLTKVEMPDALVEEEIDSIVEEFTRELQQQGATLDQFLQANKKELKDFREQHRKEAIKRLTLRFGLQQLFEQEKFELTPEKLQSEVEHIIGLYPNAEQHKVKKQYEAGSYLLRRLENKLKMDMLFERFLK